MLNLDFKPNFNTPDFNTLRTLLPACACIMLVFGCENSSTALNETTNTASDDDDSEFDSNFSGDTNTETDTVEAPTAGRPVAIHGNLHVQGAALLDEYNRPVMLRGQGFGWDNWWPQYYNADVVNWLVEDWCVDMVRPAMGIEPDNAYLDDPETSKSHISAVVEAAIAEDIYVIIDWHAHELHQEEAVAFFAEMAQTYGDYPNVIYEVFNEPTNEQSWPEVKAYAEAVIGAIRTYDADNIVIVGSPEWDQRIDLVAEDPITDYSNILYSVHFYADTHGVWLRTLTETALLQDIPVIISESGGSEATGLGDNNYTQWEAWFEFLDSYNVSWINYSISDKAGETISALQPGADDEGGWTETDLTETGNYIRGVFRDHCSHQ